MAKRTPKSSSGSSLTRGEALPEDLEKQFHAEFASQMHTVSGTWLGNDPSDHAVALVRAAMLETALGEAIRRVLVGNESAKEKMVGNNNYEAPLGSFSARVTAGLVLGLYGETTHRDLDLIRQIRNAFAHWPTEKNPHRKNEVISFGHNTIANWCRSLRLPEHFRRPDYFKVEPGTKSYRLEDLPDKPPINDPRERYLYTTNLIMHFILFIDPGHRPKIIMSKQHLP